MSRDHDKRRKRSSSKCNKLRMDSNISSLLKPQGEDTIKRKEIDSVMRKAREFQTNYWNKKLLEVEARDPNRWRHSGYKEMYIGECSIRHSKNYLRSPRHQISRSRSPKPRYPKSPRSPKLRNSHLSQSRNLHSKCLKQRIRSSQSPQINCPVIRRSQTPRLCSPKIQKSRSHSPDFSPLRTFKEQSMLTKIVDSPSSGSTCSDQSCSVCSSKVCRSMVDTSNSKSKSPSPIKGHVVLKEAVFSRSVSKKHNRINSSSTPRVYSSQTTLPLQCRSKEHEKISKDLKTRKKQKLGKSPDDPRISQMMHKRIKVENTHSDKSVVQANIESSASDDSDSSSATSHHPPPRMTLSERFGKMAQWSVDRRDMENMRITKVGNSTMKVVVEGEERITRLGYDSPPPGHYPEALLTQGPRGLDSWDDVHVRYDYYKSRGYLRDLTLDDYIKWEEWWYKYQEWLEAERYYEQWAVQSASRSSSGSGRKRRRRNNTTH
ncbi:uncharacterized protein LOC131666647 [Phymastichus coffea]|uniref:uncharacterized protein LOC131666647 n=1 Tax=Phymastichus coffea TaxID=108790 RepID=UPI00273C7367|nr:uncharacterized protein LOC131666647 [Phymastichus coffea]